MRNGGQNGHFEGKEKEGRCTGRPTYSARKSAFGDRDSALYKSALRTAPMLKNRRKKGGAVRSALRTAPHKERPRDREMALYGRCTEAPYVQRPLRHINIFLLGFRALNPKVINTSFQPHLPHLSHDP